MLDLKMQTLGLEMGQVNLMVEDTQCSLKLSFLGEAAGSGEAEHVELEYGRQSLGAGCTVRSNTFPR